MRTMGKKLLEGKSGEAGFWHDTPEQMQMCLSCKRPLCIDCIDMKAPPDEEEIDFSRPLRPDELTILSVYAVCKDDNDMSRMTGISKPKIFRYRKQLGLPPANQLSDIDRRMYVELWMRE